MEFAGQFGVQLSLKNLREVQIDATLVEEFIAHLLQVIAQKTPTFSELEWKDIYERYVKICKRVFTTLSDGKIVQVLIISAPPLTGYFFSRLLSIKISKAFSMTHLINQFCVYGLRFNIEIFVLN